MTKTEEIMELVAKRDDALKAVNRCGGPAWKIAAIANNALKSAIEELVADAARYQHIKIQLLRRHRNDQD